MINIQFTISNLPGLKSSLSIFFVIAAITTLTIINNGTKLSHNRDVIKRIADVIPAERTNQNCQNISLDSVVKAADIQAKLEEYISRILKHRDGQREPNDTNQGHAEVKGQIQGKKDAVPSKIREGDVTKIKDGGPVIMDVKRDWSWEFLSESDIQVSADCLLACLSLSVYWTGP